MRNLRAHLATVTGRGLWAVKSCNGHSQIFGSRQWTRDRPPINFVCSSEMPWRLPLGKYVLDRHIHTRGFKLPTRVALSRINGQPTRRSNIIVRPRDTSTQTAETEYRLPRGSRAILVASTNGIAVEDANHQRSIPLLQLDPSRAALMTGWSTCVYSTHPSHLEGDIRAKGRHTGTS